MSTPTTSFAGQVNHHVGALEALRGILAASCESLHQTAYSLDETATHLIEVLLAQPGKVVVTGVGKAGHVAQKVAATFCSLGVPAVYLHSADAVHGDLGAVEGGDFVLAISKSGESAEVVEMARHLQRRGAKLGVLTTAANSTLARLADAVVTVHVLREGDAFDLAPLASAVVFMAVGDALAVEVAKARGRGLRDFTENHPGGLIGRRLTLQVADLMTPADQTPRARPHDLLRDAICTMSRGRLGAVFVCDGGERILGILTDGDLRRLLECDPNPLDLTMSSIMHADPVAVTSDTPAKEALFQMETAKITVLPVVDSDRVLIGALHLHQLVTLGLGLS